MRLTFDVVQKEVEQRGDGYKLLRFTKSTEKMGLLCPNGHEFEIYISNFRKGQRCSKCVGGIRYTYNYIKGNIEKEDYKLLSKTYKNNTSKLRLECSKGHKYETTWVAFKRGCRCPVCNGGTKISYNYVSREINNTGYKLISKNYINSRTKLSIICPHNHTFDMTWNNFQRGQRCPVCSGNSIPTIEHIKDIANSRDYDLIDGVYINSKSYITFKCPLGHVFKMMWNNFQQGQSCPVCARNKTTSKAENEIYRVVKDFCCDDVIPNDRTQIVNPVTGHMLELDIWIPSMRKAIEFNGEYWHSSDYSIYKDMQKIIQSKDKDIDLLVINEEDWNKDKSEQIEIIKDFLI